MASLRKKLIFVVSLFTFIYFISENLSHDITNKRSYIRKKLYKTENLTSISNSNESEPNLPSKDEDILIPPLFIKNITTNSTNNVFLLETGNHQDFSPNFRLLGSIESWSASNPDLQVWFLVKCTRVLDGDGLLKKLLQHHPNFRIALLDPSTVLENTPILSVFNGKFKKCETKAAHLSDFLRLALLWKFGGYYSDTDTVCIKSVSHLHNVVGLTNNKAINSAVCNFDKGHILIWNIMKKVEKSYNPKNYFSVIKAVGGIIKEACNLHKNENIEDLTTGKDRCKGVTIMPSKAFFPLNGKGASAVYFKPKRASDFTKIFESSYVLHMAATWNTEREIVRVGEKTLYEKAIELYSPIIHRAVVARTIAF